MRRAYKVLACTSAEAERRLRLALQGDEVTMALTFAEALEKLRDPQAYDVVLVGMLFHESRGLELMERIAASPEARRLPVVGVRGAKFRRFVHPEVFDLPMKALGAVDILDFGAIPDDEQGNAALRERIRRCVRRPSE